MYDEVVKCLDNVYDAINSESLSFITNSFVYGSVSKHCISNESDVDLLLIGTKAKSIDLISYINKILDSYNTTSLELDVKYYDIVTFRNIRSSNVFLNSIKNDVIRLEDASNELLRFCSKEFKDSRTSLQL